MIIRVHIHLLQISIGIVSEEMCLQLFYGLESMDGQRIEKQFKIHLDCLWRGLGNLQCILDMKGSLLVMVGSVGSKLFIVISTFNWTSVLCP